MTPPYTPGLHILSTFSSSLSKLTSIDDCRLFYDAAIAELALNKVGEVYHEFANGAFTAVICLTESHISIHTWPEYGHATFDVFLSNYNQDNTAKARSLYERTIEFFQATETNKHEVLR